MPVSPDSLVDLLEPLCSAPQSAAVITDFDGTLAPIVEDPALAAALPGAPELLRRLARCYARVAVVSGRPAAFLADALQLDGSEAVIASGLYGLELLRNGAVAVHPEAEPWR